MAGVACFGVIKVSSVLHVVSITQNHHFLKTIRSKYKSSGRLEIGPDDFFAGSLTQNHHFLKTIRSIDKSSGRLEIGPDDFFVGSLTPNHDF